MASTIVGSVHVTLSLREAQVLHELLDWHNDNFPHGYMNAAAVLKDLREQLEVTRNG